MDICFYVRRPPIEVQTKPPFDEDKNHLMPEAIVKKKPEKEKKTKQVGPDVHLGDYSR